MSIFHKRQKQMETEQPGLTFLGYYVRRRTDLEWEWYCEDGAWHPAAADMPGKKMWQTKEEFEAFIRYHLATCERMELMGASGHTVDILRAE